MTVTCDRGDASRFPRLLYAAECLFGDADVWIHYGDRPVAGAVFVPRKSDLLFVKGTRPVAPPDDFSDILFAAFYFLTEYDCWSGAVGTDKFGRYRDFERAAVRRGLIDEPFLDLEREKILRAVSPQRLEPRLELIPTLDVDGPWKYKHKPFWVQWAGMLKGDVRRRLLAATFGRDPYDAAWERVRLF
ncbi:MAG: hypothetical protein RMM53_11780, partial [Bacteroidia bacterium]|nr:hypothetical protein [Bacteroidia bacterium]